MRKNQIFTEPEFRAELQALLREVADQVGSIRQMSERADVATTNAAKALKVDPDVATFDSVLLKLGQFYFDLEVIPSVRIAHFNAKKPFWKKTSYRLKKDEERA